MFKSIFSLTSNLTEKILERYIVSSGRFRFLSKFLDFFLIYIFSSTEKLTFWHSLNLKMIFNSGYKKKPYLSRYLESILVFTGIGIIFHAFLLEKSTQVVCVPCRSQSLEPKEYVKFYELTYTFSIGICYMCKYQFLSLLVVFRGFSAGYSFGNLVAL